VELVYKCLSVGEFFFRLWFSGLWHRLFLGTIVPENVLIHFGKDIPPPPPESWRYSIRQHGVIIQETTIVDFYRCDNLKCHVGNWWCLQEADWDVGLVHPTGIATVGIPSTSRIWACRTVNTAALHLRIISPWEPTARSRNKWVSTVFLLNSTPA
jgi:hypothetical protein